MKRNIKDRKIISIILIAIVLLCMSAFTINVNAANDVLKTSLVSSSSQVKRGDNITVTIKLSTISIESGEKGIGAYTAKLDFDSSRLEYVSAKGTDKWETPFYKDTLIVGNTNDGTVVSSPQNVGSITFKIKENAEAGNTTIKLTNFYGSTAETDVLAENSSVNITIKVDEQSGNENQNGNETQGGSSDTGEGNTSGTNTPDKDDKTKPGENNPNASENKGEQGQENEEKPKTENEKQTTGSSSKAKNNTVSKQYLPYTGKFEGTAIITVIGVMTIWMIVSYIGLIKVSKKKVKDEEK